MKVNTAPSIRKNVVESIELTKSIAEKLMGTQFPLNPIDQIYFCSESIRRFKECVDGLRKLSS